MLVYGRGLPNPIEIPDGPAPATTTALSRGPAADTLPTVEASATKVSSAPVAAAASTLILETTSAQPSLQVSASTGSGGSAPFVPIMSVATELLVAADSQRGISTASASAGEALGRGEGDGAVVFESLSFASFADNGWFIVPSAANEYGESYASADGFIWDVAAGEFTSDWFFV